MIRLILWPGFSNPFVLIAGILVAIRGSVWLYGLDSSRDLVIRLDVQLGFWLELGDPFGLMVIILVGIRC